MSGLDQFRAQQTLEAMNGGIVTADTLSASVGVSSRTIYRYVQMLRADGHVILSDPGVGYFLQRRAPAQGEVL